MTNVEGIVTLGVIWLASTAFIIYQEEKPAKIDKAFFEDTTEDFSDSYNYFEEKNKEAEEQAKEDFPYMMVSPLPPDLDRERRYKEQLKDAQYSPADALAKIDNMQISPADRKRANEYAEDILRIP